MKLTQNGALRRHLLLVLTVFSITLAPSLHAASNVQGTINGQVIGSEERTPVANAAVVAVNTATGLTRSVTTDADGEFFFSSLPVGQYDVSVDAPGVPAETRTGVAVNIGTSTQLTILLGEDAAQLQAVTVSGNRISPLDIGSTELATNLGEQTIDRLPVGRSITEVALLAPGTTRGDTAFGNLASFGGATVGENVCYINGLNVTNFRNGLGCSTVPFEFYQEFQLKTGGYSAEFGRATGGVINAVTKSGSNEYHAGANIFWEPWIDDLTQPSPDTFFRDTGELYVDNLYDESTEMEANIFASGPVIKDRMFFYVLYNARDVQTDSYDEPAASFYDTNTDDGFWGAKLDFNITSDHIVELTAFSDERDVTTKYYDYAGRQGGMAGPPGATTRQTTTLPDGSTVGIDAVDQRGGSNFVARYTGYFTPDFNVSVMYGENEYDLSSTSGVLDLECPLVIDVRAGATNSEPGCWASSLPEYAIDERQAVRVDGEWFLGDHRLNFGFDRETNTSGHEAFYSGGYYWRYGNFADGTEYARLRYLNQIGDYETETSALYVEDTWQVTEDLVLRLGLRNETFTNSNSAGEAFIDISNQIAPRLGLSWDPFGNGDFKVFANYGRYYLPVANNTNVRLAGSETFSEAYFFYDQVDPDTGLPITFIDANGDTITFDPSQIVGSGATTNYQGAVPDSYNLYANGVPPDTSSIVDANIDPMYQDELILGFMKDFGNGWSAGTRFIHRDLKSTLEDLTTDAAFEARFPGSGCGIGAFHYVLANPGSDVTITWDCPTGTPETYTLTADELGFPESERYYNALEFLFERGWDGEWFLQGSYTWSQSYGNNEGYVRSDNGQDDAGLTTLYDFPGLLDGAYGYLPNDRRHAFKIFGAWQFADNWRLGANALLESGRPVNAFGVNPNDPFAALYGAESFYQQGELVPRGTRGRTAFKSQVDLSLDYETVIGSSAVGFGVDVFNIFNSNVATELNERAEDDTGAAERRYLLPTAYQTPRYVRLRAQVTF